MEIPMGVCKATKAVLLSNNKGVLLKNFTKDYKSLLGEDFPWKKLEYDSPLDALKAMKNSAVVKYDEGENDYRIFGIASGHSYISTPLLKAQWSEQKDILLQNPSKQKKKGKKGQPNRSKQKQTKKISSKGTEGLVVCVRYVGRPGVDWHHKYWKDSPMCNHMSKAGKITEVFLPKSPQMNYGFVHFSTVKEAQTAIDMFHSSRYQGTRFLVTWATPRPQGSVPPPTDHNFLSHDSHMTDDVTFDHHQMLPSTLSTPPYGSKVYVGTSPTMTSPSAGFPGPTSQHYTETRMSDSFEESSTDSNSIIIEEDPDVDEVGRSSTFEVFVSEVESPSYFFVQTSPTILEDLRNLSDSISLSCPLPVTAAVNEGEIYCVITQQRWTRFVLTSVINNLDQVKGTDVDSGRPVMARLSDLHYLPRSHSVRSTHPLALPCCLHGVESTHRQGWWPPDSQLLWKLTREKVHAVFRRHPCPPPAACCVELYLDDRRSKNIAEILQSSGTYVSFTSQFLEEDDQLVDQLESMGMVESGFHVNTPCGSHDPATKQHNPTTRSHDPATKSHDADTRSHDINSTPHDRNKVSPLGRLMLALHNQ